MLMVTGCVTPLVVLTATVANAAPCDAPVVNKVLCENTKPGTPDWQVSSRDDSILGYTTDISATPGGQVAFKMLTNASSYTLDIFRLGWYGGVGARQVGSVSRNTPQNQPPCLRDTPSALIDCGNWAVSVTWNVPADAVSGIYYARVTRNDNGLRNEIAFVVRDDTSTSKILFQTSDSTWVAYNRYGGNSLYFGDGPGQGGQAYKVSYNRPYTGGDGDENFIFNAEYPMLRFMERNGYDMSYTTDVDSARRGHLIKNHKVFMAVGHDEYWSNEQRANVEAARDAGVHLAFLTGNEIFWKTRWEKSIDSSKTDWRTVACYKETKGTQNDQLADWTGTWRDPRYSPPQDGGRPENSLLGNIFTVNGRRDDSLQVPAAYGRMRLWRHTSLQNMAAGSTYTFQPGTLGYEWNTVEDNGYQPAGVGQFSRTTVAMLDGPYVLQNHGDYYTPDTKTHAITYYKYPSGSLVFGAGTVQWAWGLDDDHAFLTNTPTSDIRMQQATVNFLADMGVQAGTLMPGLVQASAISDTTPPTVTYTSVPALSAVGRPYTFSGTVTDSGQVTGVEVSTDGGVRWHPAVWQAGQTSWSYTYTPPASGSAQLRVRAVDDSLNLSTPATASPGVAARTCPCGLWTDNDTPKTPDILDGSALELGVKWRANTDGYVRGVKFYKGPGNTGTHTGTLWTRDGQQLATGTFVNETASGWQTLVFPVPVAVTGNTTYVVSYLSPTGHFSVDTEYFSRSSRYLEPLTGLQTGVDGANGVFRSGAGFPDRSSQDSNYWVDVLWAPDPGPDTRAPELVGTNPLASAASVGLNPTLSATYDEAVNPSTVQFTLTGPGGSVAGTTSVTGNGKTAQFTPNAALNTGTAYTASVKAKDAAGNETQLRNWTFTTGSNRSATCPCTIWDDFATPATASADDGTPVEVGTKVRFNGKGEVLGVRFYKGAGNTGTHKGSLWSSNGLLLGTGTFTGETASGWQTLTFASPVVVQANTTYVVSYYAPNGHYAVTPGYFNGQSASYGAMRALSNGIDGPNGVYRYGAGGGFPQSSFNAANYWVDAIYKNGLNGDTTPPTLNNRTPGTDATNVGLNSSLSLAFSEAMDPASTQISLSDPGGAKLHGSVALSADQKTVTWTPNGALKPNTRYTADVLLADVNGNAMASHATWSFTTSTTASCPCSLFSTATVPTTTSADDSGAYELGVRFSPTQSGQITGVKFYKGEGNTGTHTGSLWSSAGVRLATGTFTGETANGWQTLTFNTPVTVAPGLMYTASYYAPNGHYSIDNGYFQASGVTASPLTAPQTGDGNPNGVFQTGGGFPTMSHQGNNYWVDVVYTPNSDTTPPVGSGHTPLTDAVDVSLTTQVTASFDEPIDLTNTQFSVSDPGGARLDGTLTRSADQQTVLWTPAAPLAASTRYTVSVRAADTGGNIMAAPLTWSFTATTSQTCPCSLFSPATVPTVPSADDNGGYELGVRFTPSADGRITGVKFYKGTGNTGTHTGTIWSADGVPLKIGTFAGETASGWQTLTFGTPLAVTAGTTYVASYTAPNGHYSVNHGYFAGYTATSPPLAAPATAEGAPNGLYQVGTGFPTNSYQGNHYWVDVVFTTD
ncbi:methionine-rich copper-binding protein CopC [Saccharothrix tamanrassetensis]|uniref:Methionine-rich copper-binding protein CopC n=2 Tax=Saccharothrix tamanrassetensis TaxID=1051531 RepID=A0A841CQ43_9PSEU|nr:methionine-rich copper-binding protein CopC [Saccharothrix tamanrassetensis]